MTMKEIRTDNFLAQVWDKGVRIHSKMDISSLRFQKQDIPELKKLLSKIEKQKSENEINDKFNNYLKSLGYSECEIQNAYTKALDEFKDLGILTVQVVARDILRGEHKPRNRK